ncbi:MAG: hypothetical protein KOO62_09835 [candidate division Zixibacteria bacterium]|nr:hypothetical protein [candidate division Zixibacteria bacterium]
MKVVRPEKRDSVPIAILMHLLIPGLGHIYWKEYLFGLFIFLITLTASVLFVVSLFIAIPVPARLVIYGLPVLFYIFSFVDLFRSVRTAAGKVRHTQRRAIVCLTVGFIFQLFWPLAPANLAVRNFPDIFIQNSGNLSPFHLEGDFLKASSLSYFFSVWVVDKRIIHSLPERFDLVRFHDETGTKQCGWVVGFPAEVVELADGILIVDNTPIISMGSNVPALPGDWPLVSVGGYNILIVTMNLGTVERFHEIDLGRIVGKVGKVF